MLKFLIKENSTFDKLLKRVDKHIDKLIEKKEEDIERQENYLFNKQKLAIINDICDGYKRGSINPYIALRNITNIVKSIGGGSCVR